MYLPDLILIELFYNFNYEELFNLRIVCKRWKLLIEYLAKNQTRIYVSPSYNYNPKKKINNEIIKYEEVIDQQFFENFCLVKNYFTDIKKLILYRTNLINFESERFGSNMNYILEDLEELHILSRSRDFSERMSDDDLFDKVLNFKNLKFLKLKMLTIIDFYFKKNLTLNSPILDKICFRSHYLNANPIGIPILKSYDTIKTLECTNPVLYNRELVNLEHLICRCIDSNFNLSNYPKLKRLDLFPSIDEIPIIENLFRQKNKDQNFNDLQILIFGLPISIVDKNARNLCSIFKMSTGYFYTKGGLEPIKKNYLNLKTDHIPWDYVLIYNDSIVDTFQYFSKIDIYEIVADDLKENKTLINFIIKIGGVKNLSLRRCKIGKITKEYFKKVPFLSHLALLDCKIEGKCDFICNIKKLNSFNLKTNYYPLQDFIDDCNKESFETLILILRDLISITIHWKDNEVRIFSKDYKFFGGTIKNGKYKLNDILPVLLNKIN